MIGVTKWPFDQASIDNRQGQCDHYGDPSDQCKNENWFIRELSQQLADKEIRCFQQFLVLNVDKFSDF